MPGSQDYAQDPRNDGVLVYLNGSLVPRDAARVSVFDAGFALGDGVWEGVRLQDGAFLFLRAHLGRLFDGARAIGLSLGMDEVGLTAALCQTARANNMRDGVHVRLMATRGPKRTVNQDPRNALGQPTIVIVAEYKAPSAPEGGLSLATSRIRCTPSDMFDMRLNSHSRLNLILALQDVIEGGADEALMLDPHEFVSSCNATNFFIVRNGQVITSSGDYCFNGITRANVLLLCERHGIPAVQCDFSLAEARGADEAFVTGTFGGITAVGSIDGVRLKAAPGPITQQLGRHYEALKAENAAANPHLS
jgi:branched-chain amino acid aminotransferase